VDEALEQAAGDLRGQQGVAGHDGAHAFDELVGRSAFEQKAAGAGTDRLIDVLVEVEGREDQHLGRRVGAGEQAPGGFQAVQNRHADVHQDEVGRKLSYLGERVAAVVGLADDVEVGLGLEDHPQPAADQCFVVDDQDADHGVMCGRGSRARTIYPASGRGPV